MYSTSGRVYALPKRVHKYAFALLYMKYVPTIICLSFEYLTMDFFPVFLLATVFFFAVRLPGVGSSSLLKCAKI